MAHTPGPWSIVWEDDDGEPFDNGVRIDSPEGPVAFNVIDCSAILIAAAPELLATITEIAEHCEARLRKGRDSGDELTLGLCRKAIAKSTGQGTTA